MSEKQPERIGLAWIFTGILWSVMGGWAIWLAMLRINGEIINSRFTLPFMPGAVLLVVGYCANPVPTLAKSGNNAPLSSDLRKHPVSKSGGERIPPGLVEPEFFLSPIDLAFSGSGTRDDVDPV